MVLNPNTARPISAYLPRGMNAISKPRGPVIKKRCERTWERFDESKYEWLAGISVSHRYNLRQSTAYQRQRCVLTKTRPKAAKIGTRRKPCPNDQHRVISASILSIRATRIDVKGFITSMCPAL